MAMVVPAWSSERPAQVEISGWAAASRGCIRVVRCTAKCSTPPSGVGTENSVVRAAPALGAFASEDRTREASTRNAV